MLGVPGAGKTTTIAFVVRALHILGRSVGFFFVDSRPANRRCARPQVLVTAYTHAALDNLLLKLRELGIPLLRLGHASSIHKDLKGCQARFSLHA